MELNKKKFLGMLSQIKAYKDVVLFQDSAANGYIDILYLPKNSELPFAVHKITCRCAESETGLTDDCPACEKLGEPVLSRISTICDVLKNSNGCDFQNGKVNGMVIETGKQDEDYLRLRDTIKHLYNEYSDKTNATGNRVRICIKSADWSYLFSECIKFVSTDYFRIGMRGICFDFFKGGDKFVDIVATDGQKLILCKHPRTDERYVPKEEDSFVVLPQYLFVPKSTYNSVQLQFGEEYGRLEISTEDFLFVSLFKLIDGTFPNYPSVIPALTDETEWFTLCDKNFRETTAVSRGIFSKDDMIHLNAERPDSIMINSKHDAVEGEPPTFKVDGSASRPMKIDFALKNLLPCLCKGMLFTKFYVNAVSKAVFVHSDKNGRGVTPDVTKIFMPLYTPSDHEDENSFGISNKDSSDNPVGYSDECDYKDYGEDAEEEEDIF